MVDISGTVYRYGSRERISGALLKATPEAGEVRLAITDDDGDFNLAALEPGKWRLVAFHEASHPGEVKEIELQEDVTGVRIDLFRRMGTEDEQAGRKFFYGLLAGLAALAVLYILLHLFIPDQGVFLWDQEPLRLLEVLFWGLAGVLVNLIVTVSGYLRWRNFYREGIVMHISQIVTVPFLVLISVILLSLVTLTVTLLGNEIQLDLSDARILVAISFLLGSRPWSVWNFIQSSAERVIGGE